MAAEPGTGRAGLDPTGSGAAVHVHRAAMARPALLLPALPLFSALLLTFGCARATTHATTRAAEPPPVTVEVVNRGWDELVIHAIRSTNRVRLGQVGALTTTRFRVPDEFVHGAGSLVLTASPVGSDARFESEPLTVAPGDVARLTLRPQLRLSSVTLR